MAIIGDVRCILKRSIPVRPLPARSATERPTVMWKTSNKFDRSDIVFFIFSPPFLIFFLLYSIRCVAPINRVDGRGQSSSVWIFFPTP